MKSMDARNTRKRWHPVGKLAGGVMLAYAVLSPSAWACGGGVAGDPWVSPWKMEDVSVLTSPLIEQYATELVGAWPSADGSLTVPQISLRSSSSAARTLPFSRLGGSIVYVRSEGGAGERICREELWQSRKYGSWDSAAAGLVPREVPLSLPVAVDIDPSAKTAVAELLRQISSEFVLVEARDYLYDDQERLVEIRNNGRGSDGRLFSQPVSCIRYDQQGRPTWSAEPSPLYLRRADAPSCDQMDQGNALVQRLLLDQEGRFYGSIATKPPAASTGQNVMASVRGTHGWTGVAEYRRPSERSVYGYGTYAIARLDQQLGVYTINSIEGDLLPADAQPLYQDAVTRLGVKGTGLRYDFVNVTIPAEVGMNGFSKLSTYPRIRSHRVAEKMRVHEVFDAGSHNMRRRVWANESGPIYRQEDYDEAGRLVQVINAWENPDVPMPEDAIAADGFDARVLQGSGQGYRVFRFDRRGRPQRELVCGKIVGGAESRDEMHCGKGDRSVVVYQNNGVSGFLTDTYGWRDRPLAAGSPL